MVGYINDSGLLCLYCGASTARRDEQPVPAWLRNEQRSTSTDQLTETPTPAQYIGLPIEHAAARGRILNVRS